MAPLFEKKFPLKWKNKISDLIQNLLINAKNAIVNIKEEG
jgi:hypothetical protein